ncbi:hypothetical protein LUZ60_006060 [Juncus effusus]|nr:hypothetical protein LUZ60_006060 [Juncus effusus]
MDLPSNEWLSELEIDNIASDLDPLTVRQLAESLSEELQNPQFHQENYNQISNPNLFTFGTSSSVDYSQIANPKKRNDGFLFSQDQVLSWGGKEERENTDVSMKEKIRLPDYAQEHVVAERKRREKLSQQFIALATIVPGLKKTDKVSLLGSAIDYLKTLEERVKTLEEETSKSKSAHFSSINLPSNRNDEIAAELQPKVEASLQGNNVLLRIQCEKKKGALVMVLSEIEKLCLSVINTSVFPFANSSLNMTITAEIEEGFSMKLADVVRILSSAIRHFR